MTKENFFKRIDFERKWLQGLHENGELMLADIDVAFDTLKSLADMVGDKEWKGHAEHELRR